MNLSAPTLRAIYCVALLAICGGGCRAHDDDDDEPSQRGPIQMNWAGDGELKEQINAAGRELSVEETLKVLRGVKISPENEPEALLLKQLIILSQSRECQMQVLEETIDVYRLTGRIGLNIMPYVSHYGELQLEKCWSKMEADFEEALAKFDDDKETTLFREKLAKVRAGSKSSARAKPGSHAGELSMRETAEAIGAFLRAKYPDASEFKLDRFQEKYNESVKKICSKMESTKLSDLLSGYHDAKIDYETVLGNRERTNWDNWFLDELSCRQVRGLPEEMEKLSYKALKPSGSLCSILFNCLS